MNLMRNIGKLAFSSVCWILLFLACRLLAWGMRWPVWWTLPLGLSIGIAWLAFAWICDILREMREERDAALDAPADPRLAARMRLAWKKGRRLRRTPLFQPSLPWFLCLEQAPTRCGGVMDDPGAADEDSGDGDEFSWRRGPHALWLDYPDAGGEEQGRWHAFAQQLSGRQARLAGVVVAIEADCLMLDDAARLRGRARLLRRRLDDLMTRHENLPVYVVVNRIDCLYGMRTLVDEFEPSRLRRPLGAIRRKSETPDAFARRIIAVGRDELTRLPSGSAAALQAPAELERLERPLEEFCAQLFGGDHSRLRGMYLVSSAPGGGTIPPLMVRMGTFKEINEEPPRGGSWFVRHLLREGIPGDVEQARRATEVRGVRTAFPGGAMGVFVGTLVLCWLLTWSFLANRDILLSARGLTRPPTSADMLEPYFELASQTAILALDWHLPHFGMREAEDLAEVLQRRYTDSYFDLKTVPAIETIQEAALAAGKSSDPAVIGNALLLLTVAREGIARSLHGDGDDNETTRFLHGLVDNLRLARPEDMRLLEAYFSWAGRQDWMPETCAALVEFERYITANAGDGDLSWLLSWVETVPGVKAVDVSRVWEPLLVPPQRIGGAWTAKAYEIVHGMLGAMSRDAEDSGEWEKKRDAFLAEYRRCAIVQWREAADRLWVGFRKRLNDAELPALLSAASRFDDPASRFVELLREHLLPMFSEDLNHPDAKWLLLYGGMRGKGYEVPGVEAVEPPDSVQRLANAKRERREDFAIGVRPAGFAVANPRGQAHSNAGDVDTMARRIAEALRSLGTDEGLARLSGGSVNPQENGTDVFREEWKKFSENVKAAVRNLDAPHKNLESVQENYKSRAAESEPLRRAGAHAEALHAMLLEGSGSDAWDSVSPLSSYDFLRCLVSRFAAITLDAEWRSSVYLNTWLLAGTEAERLKRVRAGGMLEKFLSEKAAGFLCWDKEGKFANGEWEGLDFWLSPQFLDFCMKMLRENPGEPPGEIPLTFKIDAISVDADALERPLTVEFHLFSNEEEPRLQRERRERMERHEALDRIVRRDSAGETGWRGWTDQRERREEKERRRVKEGKDQKVVFSNYSLVEDLIWHPGPDSRAVIRINFNALTAEREFSGKALREFFELFNGDLAVMGVEAFPDQEAALRRLGVTRLTMRARMENADRVLALYKDEVEAIMPETIIVRCGEPLAQAKERRPVFSDSER